MRRRRVLVATTGISTAFVASCSLFLDTDGLNGSAPDGGSEAASNDAAGNDVVGNDADVAIDASTNSDAKSTYADEVLADKPIAYFRLGEKAGPLAKDETNELSGSYLGAVMFDQPGAIAGDPNGAIVFGGGRVAVTRKIALAAVTPYSLEAWIKPSTIDDAYRRVLDRQVGSPESGYLLYVQAENGLGSERVSDGGYEAVATPPPPSDKFTHVVVTFDGSAMRIYVDTVLSDGPTTATRWLMDVDGELAIGGRSGGGDPFSGAIDEVAIYDKALPEMRIQAHYVKGLGL
jgi:hypothetical protein